MSVASFVLVCALDLLGRSANTFPPILVVDRPSDASTDAIAFIRGGEPPVYVVGSSTVFQRAVEANRNRQQCQNPDVLRLLASVLVHEEWHLRHGPDEEAAYLAQLTTLQLLGVGPGRWPYETARRAMEATRKRNAERVRAARRIAARAAPTPLMPSGPAGPDRPWARTVLGSTGLLVIPR